MRYVNSNQINQIKKNITNTSTSAERDLLLVMMSVEVGIKPVHLAELRVCDVIRNGEVVKKIKQTPVPEHIRKGIAVYLKNRFKTDHKRLGSVSLHLFTNREERAHFTDQSMAVHLTYLIKKSGVNATATALRNSFIRDCAISGNAADLVKFTHVRNPATVVRYLLGEFEEVEALQI